MTALDALLPEADAVTAWWQRHGLPGLFDVHVHFMAPPVQRAVWEVFDSAGPKIGRPWPIRYRLPDEERVALLRALGVRRFSALSYAHKPGVATFLNDWSRAFAERVPESLWSATLYPEESVLGYVTDLVADGVEIFKVHVQVGEFLLDDPLLDPVWGLLADAGTPVVIHVGSGPVGNAFTGPDELSVAVESRERHPYDAGRMAAAEERQREKLDWLRSHRDAGAHRRALDRLRRSAEDPDEGLVPPTIECLRASATLGEICDALRDVFGVHRSGSTKL